MPLIEHFAWLLTILLRYAGVAVIFAGVGLFGVYFIGGNARSVDQAVPASSWRGKGPVKALKIVGIGALMLVAAYLASQLIPDGS